jgi:hypothetical protein
LQFPQVIEAVYENTALKKDIFSKLDAICKPSTVLCSNTSTIDIDIVGIAVNVLLASSVNIVSLYLQSLHFPVVVSFFIDLSFKKLKKYSCQLLLGCKHVSK